MKQQKPRGKAQPGQRTRSEIVWRWLIIGAGALFVGSVVWSALVETLLPLAAAGNMRDFFLNLVGITVAFIGTAVFVYGGVRVVRDTFHTMGDPQVMANVIVVREKPSRADVARARRENTAALWRGWKPGLLWMLGGFAILALGSVFINLGGG